MTKSDIRRLYKQKRSALSKDEIHNLSLSICSILTSSFDFSFKKTSIFLPIKDKNEVDTWIILETLLAHDALIGLPKVDFDTSQLIHLSYKDKDELEVSVFGIPEPKNGNFMQPKDFDFVLVPLLALNENGQRVGYGKGFYDNFLSNCSNKCTFIGLHFFDEFVKIDDLNDGDVPLHFYVNPNRIVSFEK